MKTLWIIGFGVLGVFSRYGVGNFFAKSYPSFPAGTFVINIAGSFAIGIIYVIGAERALVSEELRIAIMVGFLGGFTTFSSYSLEVARLLQSSHFLTGTLYAVLSPALGILATLAGILLARWVSGNPF